MAVRTVAVGVLALIVAACSGGGVSDEEYRAALDQITALDAQVETLTAEADQADAEIAGLTTERDDARAQVAAVTGELDELEVWRPVIEDVESALATLTTREAEVEARTADLDARAADLSALADELDERETAIRDIEELAARSTIGDGITFIGENEDALPGLYRTDGTGADCYWQVSPQGSSDDIIDSHSGDATGQSVTLTEGQQFETDRCGTWTQQ